MDPNNPCDSEFVIGRNKTAQVVRKKFPLRPAAAKTTHSSQGDNKTRIVVNFSTREIIPHIHYVGLRRVTAIEGLYISDLCESKIVVNPDIKKDMKRLRTAKLKLCISPLYDITPSLRKLCYLSARSLHKHIEDIHKDLNYSSADINMFTETKLSSQDNNDMYDIAGYALFQNDNLNSSNGSRPYGGAAVNSKIPFLPGYPYCHNIHNVEITAIKLTSLLFTLNWLLKTDRRPMYNLLIRDKHYKQLISTYTTDNNTVIDHMYANIFNIDVQAHVLDIFHRS